MAFGRSTSGQGADVIYNEPTFPALVATLSDRRLCSDKTLVYLATMLVCTSMLCMTQARGMPPAPRGFRFAQLQCLLFGIPGCKCSFTRSRSSTFSSHDGLFLDLVVRLLRRWKRFAVNPAGEKEQSERRPPGPAVPPLCAPASKQILLVHHVLFKHCPWNVCAKARRPTRRPRGYAQRWQLSCPRLGPCLRRRFESPSRRRQQWRSQQQQQ